MSVDRSRPCGEPPPTARHWELFRTLAGPDQYGTALAVADALGDPSTVMLGPARTSPTHSPPAPPPPTYTVPSCGRQHLDAGFGQHLFIHPCQPALCHRRPGVEGRPERNRAGPP